MEIASLADLLHETSERHGAFEAVAPPHDWWDWYAAYMDARQSESSPDEASAAAGRYMAEAKGIVVPPARESGTMSRIARTSQAVWTGSLGAKSGTTGAMRLSDELEGWLRGDGDKTLGSLIDLFEERSFAILFLFLLAPSALPLPTGGVTQVLEVIAIVLALQLIANRDCVWLPRRWKAARPRRRQASTTCSPG